MKVLIVFYSMYGHVYQMAEAEAEGAKTVPGADVTIRRIVETLPAKVLAAMGAVEAQKVFSHIPVCSLEELESADAVIFGSPTRFGSVAAQMRQFMDSTGGMWAKGSMVGKVGECSPVRRLSMAGRNPLSLVFMRHCCITA